MSWGWSHSSEAYEDAHKRLCNKSLSWLLDCLAECMASSLPEDEEGCPDYSSEYELDVQQCCNILQKLKKESKEAKKAGVPLAVRKEDIAGQIWSYAEQYRTTDNGGHNFWMCPHGCHTV